MKTNALLAEESSEGWGVPNTSSSSRRISHPRSSLKLKFYRNKTLCLVFRTYAKTIETKREGESGRRGRRWAREDSDEDEDGGARGGGERAASIVVIFVVLVSVVVVVSVSGGVFDDQELATSEASPAAAARGRRRRCGRAVQQRNDEAENAAQIRERGAAAPH